MQNPCSLNDAVLPHYMVQIFKEQLTRVRSKFRELQTLPSVVLVGASRVLCAWF